MPHKELSARNAYHRGYYRGNKAAINGRQIKINRDRRHARYAEIQKIKEASPCTDCDKSFPYYVMDFDHRDPATKFADVSSMVKRMFAWDKVLAEVAKCDLVCVCCHRLRTYDGDENYRSRRFKIAKAFIDQLKTENPCKDCGVHFEACQMDFDHTGEKTGGIAWLLSKGATLGAIQSEIARCDLVCANCHRERTQARTTQQEAA
jgi:hypothetical protein